jgi:hypothetical protein
MRYQASVGEFKRLGEEGIEVAFFGDGGVGAVARDNDG